MAKHYQVKAQAIVDLEFTIPASDPMQAYLKTQRVLKDKTKKKQLRLFLDRGLGRIHVERDTIKEVKDEAADRDGADSEG